MAGDRMNDRSSVLPEGFAHILERLNDSDPSQRELSVDQLTDFVKHLGSLASAVTGCVVMAYLTETEKAAAESQLSVIADICTFNDIPAAVCEPITTQLADQNYEPWEQGHRNHRRHDPLKRLTGDRTRRTRTNFKRPRPRRRQPCR